MVLSYFGGPHTSYVWQHLSPADAQHLGIKYNTLVQLSPPQYPASIDEMNPKCRCVLPIRQRAKDPSSTFLTYLITKGGCTNIQKQRGMSLHQMALSIDRKTQDVREKNTSQEQFCSTYRLQFPPLELKAMWSPPQIQLNSPLKPLKQFMLHKNISKLESERLTFLKFTYNSIIRSYITFIGFALYE